jgi:hypothetical protein
MEKVQKPSNSVLYLDFVASLLHLRIYLIKIQKHLKVYGYSLEISTEVVLCILSTTSDGI